MSADQDEPRGSLHADRPIKKKAEDKLGRAGFARSIAVQLQRAPRGDSFVMGLVGPWGSGATHAPRLVDKIKVWIMPPAWRPEGTTPADLTVSVDRPKYDVRPTRGAGIYAAVMLVFTLVATVFFLLKGASAPLSTQLVFSAWFVAALGGLGGVLEGRSWAKLVEGARLAATPLVLVMLV